MMLLSLEELPQAWHSPPLLLKPVALPAILVFSLTVSRIKQFIHPDPTGLTEGA